MKNYYKKSKSYYGDVFYYNKEDILHRTDGPACEYRNGDRCWYINGKPHREDGPAMHFNSGAKQWFVKGKLHREDGPAVENCPYLKKYFLNNKGYSEKDFLYQIKFKETYKFNL